MTVLLLTAALLSLAPIEQSQAQLYIDIFPSQDNPTTQTIWIFGNSRTGRGSSSTAHYRSSIRSSGNYHVRDSWKLHSNALYFENKPTNALFNLTPLFGSTNAIDIESVQKRLPGGLRRTYIFDPDPFPFGNKVTNAPTITIGSTSRPIGKIFMNDADDDEIGIRVTPPNLVYSSNAVTRWFGSGIMNKPITDFLHRSYLDSAFNPGDDHGVGFYGSYFQRRHDIPYFAERTSNSVGVHVNRIIPEPAEYALVFGLFALAFVIVRRRMQQKRR